MNANFKIFFSDVFRRFTVKPAMLQIRTKSNKDVLNKSSFVRKSKILIEQKTTVLSRMVIEFLKTGKTKPQQDNIIPSS